MVNSKKNSAPKKKKKPISPSKPHHGPHEVATTVSSVPPVGTSVLQGMPDSFLWRLYSYPTGTAQPTGRPIRSNRGVGGQLAQLEKASSIVEKGLLNKVTGQKRDRNNLVDIPEDLNENNLAPPIPTKRARTSKVVSIFLFFVYRTSNFLCDQKGSSADVQNSWASKTTFPSCTQAYSDVHGKWVSIWISCHLR